MLVILIVWLFPVCAASDTWYDWTYVLCTGLGVMVPVNGVAVAGIVAVAAGSSVADSTGVGVTSTLLIILQHPLIDSERQTIQIKHNILAFISISLDVLTSLSLLVQGFKLSPLDIRRYFNIIKIRAVVAAGRSVIY